jgi:hypothetical protein
MGVTVTLGQLPGERAARAGSEERETPGTEVPKLGLSLAPARNGGEGVVVTQVDPAPRATACRLATSFST